jgi:hypothetical protein
MTMERVNCTICDSDKGYAGTGLCDGCWESTSRLSTFLRQPKAIQYTCRALANADERFTCLRNLGVDEPVFILRAKDKLASTIVRSWYALAMSMGVSISKVTAALQCAMSMEQWGDRHGTKEPD